MQTLFYSALVAVLMACIMADTPIDLGDAGNYAILAGAAITNVGASVIIGNVGIHPGSVVTGFGTPAIHLGAIDVANTASFSAKSALTTAYNEAAGKEFDADLSNQDLGGMTLPPGVYKFAVAAVLNGVLTLDAADQRDPVWTFQIGSAMYFGPSSEVVFKHGVGNAGHVTWQVGSSATIMGRAKVIGNVLAYASITAGAQATVEGRLLARSAAVTVVSDVIIKP